MKQYKTLIADLKANESNTEKRAEYKELLQTHFRTYSAYSGLQPGFLKAYTDSLVESGSIDEALAVYPVLLRTSPNN